MLFGGEKFLDLMRPLCRIAPGCLSQTVPAGLPGHFHALVTLFKDPANPTDENYQYYVVTITGFSITAPSGGATASPSPTGSPGHGGGVGPGGWLPRFLRGTNNEVGYAQ
jgi:hypothetical protein